MSTSGEPRRKKATVGKKPAPLTSQVAAKRTVTSKTTAVCDPVPQTQNSPAASQETIRHCAYLKWLDAGMPDGDGVNFWLEAEEELTQAR
jgi:hypothetical protein